MHTSTPVQDGMPQVPDSTPWQPPAFKRAVPLPGFGIPPSASRLASTCSAIRVFSLLPHAWLPSVFGPSESAGKFWITRLARSSHPSATSTKKRRNGVWKGQCSSQRLLVRVHGGVAIIHAATRPPAQPPLKRSFPCCSSRVSFRGSSLL